MSKCSFNTRFRRASCTVWIVALLPEPWKARSVGLTGPPELAISGGSVLCVKKVALDPSVGIQQINQACSSTGAWIG